MVNLEINNSYSRITGLKSSQFSAIRKLLSYKDPNAFYGGFSRPTYLIDKAGNFPTGLAFRVINHLIRANVDFDVDDRRKAPNSPAKDFNLKNQVTPYFFQLEAVKRAYGARRGGIEMVTGSGKSITMALLINKYKLRTLVIVPNVELKKQLKATFLELFGSLDNITVENIDSNKLKNETDYDLLLIDESHHSAASTYRKLNKTAWKNIYHRFFFTATFFRNQDHEKLLFESIAGNLVYRLTYQQALAAGAIAPLEAYYYELPKKEVEGYTYAQVYSELVVNNQERNELIAWLLLNLNAQEVSTLCLVREIKHGKILSELTGIPFTSGEDEDSRHYIEKFKSGEIKALIGTTGVLSEGVDTKPCEFVIVAGLGKAKSAFMQSIGRSIRRYPGKTSAKVVIFQDKSHRFTKSHFKAQVKILLDEYQVPVVKLS